MTARLTGTPVLETARFTLRAPVPQDYPIWRDFFLSPRATFIGGGPGFDEGRAWRAFASLIGHWAIHDFGLFAIEDRATGKAIGATGPWFPDLWPEPEIGWSVWNPAAEGTGAMAEAAQAVLDHLFDDRGWTTTVSYIDPGNARSIALAERLGATRDDTAARPAPGDLVFRHIPAKARP